MDFPQLRSALLAFSNKHLAGARFNFYAFRPGLSFKLLVIVIGASVIGVLLSSSLVLTLQRQQLVDGAETTTTRLSTSVEASLEHAMLRNEWPMASQIVHSMVEKGSVKKIRILDGGGTVRVSSDSVEVGERFDQAGPACQFCHTEATRPSNQTTIASLKDGQVLLNVNVIRNQVQCQACHDAQTKVLGLLMIEMPLANLEDQIAAGFWRLVLSSLVTVALLTGLMIIALRRLVIKPVAELTKGVVEIRAGNLDTPVRVSSHDELGDLAESFDAMRQQLHASRRETERHNQELAVLNEVALGTNQLLDIQQILDLALDTVVDKLGMQAGGIYLLDEETSRFTLRAHRGLSDAQLEKIESLRRQPGWDLSGRAAQSGQEILVSDIATESRFQGLWDDMHGRSYANVPLKSKGQVVGTMGLATYAGQPLTAHEVEVLKAVGSEIGTALDNALLIAETRRREQEAITLSRLVMQISGSLEIDQVLQTIAESARQTTNADIGAIGIIDEKRLEVVVRACAGARTHWLKGLTISIKKQSTNAESMRIPIVLDEWGPQLPIPHIAELVAVEGIVSSLAVPMWRGERLYGLLGIMTRQRHPFPKDNVLFLSRLAQQVAVAIENAELYKQVRYVATLEERDRLAREMHDNLAQTLGYINVKASIIDDQFSRGQITESRLSLLELKQITREAYTDVREAIFSLRTALSSGWGLVPALREYLAEYRAHYGIDGQLEIDDRCAIEFTADVEIQITRIIQEALTNVRKHAGASRARVRFEQDNHKVRITVEDDGHGFDPAGAKGKSQQQFGLQIMRERAESVGAKLEIDSDSGSGTRVVVEVPIKPGS